MRLCKTPFSCRCLFASAFICFFSFLAALRTSAAMLLRSSALEVSSPIYEALKYLTWENQFVPGVEPITFSVFGLSWAKERWPLGRPKGMKFAGPSIFTVP